MDPVPEDYNEMDHGIDSPVLRREHAATTINSARYSRKLDMILAGGSGSNEVRAFDTRTGEIIAKVTDMEKSVICLDYANNKEQFAFGSIDSCVRVMNFHKS